jgi:ATP-dependent DNA helicase RecG
MELKDSVSHLCGVGEKTLDLLSKINILTLEDLLTYFPRRYVDYSHIVLIKDLYPGDVTLRGKFIKVDQRRGKNRFSHLTEAILADDSGMVKIIWFNQPYRANSIILNRDYFVSGEFKLSSGRLGITNPSIELAGDFTKNTARIIPVYKLIAGLSSKILRSIVAGAKNDFKLLDDYYSENIRHKYNLLKRGEIAWELHYPNDLNSLELAKQNLNLQELGLILIASKVNKEEDVFKKAISINFFEEETVKFISNLNFKLTEDQRKVSWQVLLDMANEKPMNRMLQGDVGSGKTLVAVIAALNASLNGLQTVILVPTEVLAKQHYETLNKYGLKCQLLTRGIKAGKKKMIIEDIKKDSGLIIIATHAVLSDSIEFNKLGLIVVDEQHRFGVEQRRKLMKDLNQDFQPHVLTMSATPIPRTAALIMYGEIDLSLLTQKPKGVLNVITEIVNPAERAGLNRVLIEAIDKRGEGVFIVAPSVEEDQNSKRISAKELYKKIENTVFGKRVGVGLLYGGMKSDQKNEVLNDFISGKINILVSTTVIEVGIDISRANTIIIEGPEFFGLAQLHQLRGRVGRSGKQGYCYLLPTSSEFIPERLRYFSEENDGFKLAEYDLKNRGIGELFGSLQSGGNSLNFLDLENKDLVKKANDLANDAISDESSDLGKLRQLALNRYGSIGILN